MGQSWDIYMSDARTVTVFYYFLDEFSFDCLNKCDTMSVYRSRWRYCAMRNQPRNTKSRYRKRAVKELVSVSPRSGATREFTWKSWWVWFFILILFFIYFIYSLSIYFLSFLFFNSINMSDDSHSWRSTDFYLYRQRAVRLSKPARSARVITS